LLVAPHGVRTGIIERIERETRLAQQGRPALVQIKVNSLVDEEVIDALYRASQAGVRVDLIVRGICTLRPQVPGLSDNIRVRSIVGRFLEHSRVFRFGTGTVPGAANGSRIGTEAEYWMGSADLMHRNLDRRVEALVHVTDPTARSELEQVLALSMSDNTAAFELRADGSWDQPVADPEHPRQQLQTALLRKVVGRAD
jgi:polyphosphate kinase